MEKSWNSVFEFLWEPCGYIFQGRLNELMSQIRMQNHLSSSRSDINYQMDTNVQSEIKQVSQT